MSKQTSANEIADFFLHFCAEHGDYLTNLKLQKLLYFAQGWYLAFFEKPLFTDEIQAWIHGPVIPVIYKRFKKYQHQPITEEVLEPQLTKEIKEHLIEVFEYYGKYSAYDLARITHDADPWKNARGALAADEQGNNPITCKDIQKYYSELAEQQ